MKVVKLCIIFMVVAFKYSLATLTEVDLPSVACPDLFKYVTDANEAYAIITIPTQDISDKRVHLAVTVSQRDSKNFKHRLQLAENAENTVKKFYDSNLLEYRLIFASQSEYPKLTKITVNENTICTDAGYLSPSTTVTLNSDVLLSPVLPE